MIPDSNKLTNTADKMKAVEAAWDKTPSGPKKDTTLTHYQTAEMAHTAENGADTNWELDAATHALV